MPVRLSPPIFVLALFAFGASLPAADDEGLAFFETKIRPVLVEHCYACHAGDTKQQGGLRLDARDMMRKGGESGPAVVPGKPNDSLLVKAIRHQDLEMPPKPRAKLADAVVADFVKWIELGAPDPRDGSPAAGTLDFAKARQFWSFQPPQKHAPPEVKDSAWPKNDIDRFIRAAQESAGLKPVAAADKRVLIRRTTFDLTGLPPTPEEVEAFVADESPRAFDAVVERLLQSPAYGERWARHWLDVARYAEDQAHTFGTKPNTQAFRYRDWVVAAFNEDLPYDRFLKLQIAADLLAENDTERVKHLPALGYFGLAAQYYKDNSEIVKALADELDEKIDTLSRGMLGLTAACARCHDHKFDPITTLDYYGLAGIFNSSKLSDLPLATAEEIQKYQDGAKQAREAEDRVKTFTRTEKAQFHDILAGDIARYLLAAKRVQERRAKDGKFAAKDQAKEDGLNAATLDRWFKYLETNPKVPAIETLKKLDTQTAAADATAAAEAFQQQIRTLLAERSGGKLDKDQTKLLDTIFGDNGLLVLTDDELKAKVTAEKKAELEQLQQAATQLRKEWPDKLEAKFAVIHGIVEGNGADMTVYLRGNPRKPGPVTPRRFLRVLSGDDAPRFDQGSGRRQLAEAIASPNNPLTARVFVNRVWQWHFGRGLVGTASNFGQLGERPSHPELLDYLTVRFIESGWSVKSLHREILLSATYQLGSSPDETNLGIDGDNRFLWRMNRRRLDVESWRDAILAVSGKLDTTLGGPTLDLGAGNNVRRTLYAKISRHELNGLLRLFDFPDANITSERRTETTVPQQQLFVLNSPFIVEQAKAFAARLQAESGDDTSRIGRAIALTFGRPATSVESELVLRYVSGDDPEAEKSQNKLTRWQRFAQTLLGSNEFLYVD